MKKKAKLEMETLGKILLLTAFLIIFLLLFKGCKDQMENVGVVGLNEYICWLSQAMKADLTFLFPSACNPIDVDEPQTMEGIASLMRKCWWMHGQGEKDIVSSEGTITKLADKTIFKWWDVARTCYLFTPKEDIHLTKIEEYLHTHDRVGNEVRKDSKPSTWYYIQKEDKKERGVCFDKNLLEKEEGKLQKGKRYFIIFYDERSQFLKAEENRDKIMISRDPNFGESQTGISGTLRTWGEVLKGLLKLKSIWGRCYDPKVAQIIEAEESKAENFFNKIKNIFMTCSQITEPVECVCDNSDINPSELPRGYKINIKAPPAGSDEYTLSLINKDGKISLQSKIKMKLGQWSERKLFETCDDSQAGIIQYEINMDRTAMYFVYYYPDYCHEGNREKSAIYLASYQAEKTFPPNIARGTCSKVSAEGKKEQIEEEEEEETGLEIFLGKGTTIPESIVLDKNRIGEEDKIYITYEYDCDSAGAMESCMNVKGHNLIKAELKPKSEPEPGWWERVKNFFGTPLYIYEINQEHAKEIARGKIFSRGYIDIIINTDQLKENEDYTLTINAYDESDKKTTYKTVLTKTFKFNFVPLESECKTLAKGKEEKFKLYFIGDQYLSLGNFEADLSTIVDYEGREYGIFSIEPFKSHKEKFAIYYNSYTQGTAEDLVRKCPKSILFFLSDKPFRSYVLLYVESNLGGLGAGVAYISTVKESTMSLQRTGVHEFGHAFAALTDEYEDEREGDYPSQPNCAPDKETAKEWWGDLEGVGTGNLKTGYFEGCAYVEKNIRPVQNSVMRHQMEVKSAEWEHGFGPVNERCLLKILTEEGTCEEPEDLDQMKKYTKQVREAYSKT